MTDVRLLKIEKKSSVYNKFGIKGADALVRVYSELRVYIYPCHNSLSILHN